MTPTSSSASSPLPQMSGKTYLTDSGLETDLIFNHGIDLPEFASFPLLGDDNGRTVLADYYSDHWQIAQRHNVGVVFDTPTWRASPDWAAKLDYDLGSLATFNQDAAALLLQVKAESGADDETFVVSGNLGPRGDGYVPGDLMWPDDARSYHSWQAEQFAAAGVDLISIFTVNYVNEGLGAANAIADVGLPAVISFTVETDGRMPDGASVAEAISRVDDEAAQPPAYYMLNCAHPTHVLDTLRQEGAWKQRIRGFRANASRMSHAELDESESLDAGDPQEFGELFVDVRQAAPSISILGGCCGTDSRHIAQIAEAASASGQL
jgi:S-methylmethionine-dependent homocysteine/selenocysteine methylase